MYVSVYVGKCMFCYFDSRVLMDGPGWVVMVMMTFFCMQRYIGLYTYLCIDGCGTLRHGKGRGGG